MGEGQRITDELTHQRGSTLRRRKVTNGAFSVDAAGRFSLQDGPPSQASIPTRDARTELYELAGIYLSERRRSVPSQLDYLILVPTLRCNLACSYCQVSRASEHAQGYDWNEETLKAITAIVSKLTAPAVKIEFQGGEPTLRPDLIEAIIAAVPAQVDATFVICTNLQTMDERILNIFDRDDITISTSLDGPVDVHARQRGDQAITQRFRENLISLIERYGRQKISALPTVDPLNPPAPNVLVEAYDEFGFDSIFLRPINYQGFARKNHAASREIGEAWTQYHRSFIEFLIERNWIDQVMVREETYFSLLLRRIFRAGSDRHVDLRNPNPLGHDYIVIDHDGTVYPTDEARMLSRSGVIDLSIGDVQCGWASARRDDFNAHSTLDGDPDCDTCVYQPYCGRDLVDDLSRYGTIAKRRIETEFCRRHMALFDFAFELIQSPDVKVRYSLGRWLGLDGSLPEIGECR